MELTFDVIDALAQQIHARYLTEVAVAEPSRVPWRELPPRLREAGRAQAAHLVAKVTSRGWAIVSVGEGRRLPLTADEVESLARAEHLRWVAERTARGYRLGPVRSEADLVHPDLVTWEDLTESARHKDRSAVRALPALLESLGAEVVRQ